MFFKLLSLFFIRMLAFSEYESYTDTNTNKPDNKKHILKKLTKEIIPAVEAKEDFPSSLYNDTNDNLADFNPPVYPAVNMKPSQNSNKHPPTSKIAAYSAMENSFIKPQIVNQDRAYNNDNLSSSYKQYLSSHNQNYNNNLGANLNVQSGTHTQDELLKKINYMIQLLEEEQGEKTNNVTEEVILYSFLGIFMIYMADSFARIGKYSR